MSSSTVQDKAKEVIAFYTQKLEDMGLTVKMGAEIEFLALGEPIDLDGTEAELKEEVPHIGHFKREWKCGVVDDAKGESHQFELPGVRQYEVVTETGSPDKIADAIRESRDYFERLNNPHMTVDFGPRPVQDTEPYLEGAELPEDLKEPYEIYEKVSGNGLHLNISLWNREGQNVFFDPASAGESEAFRAAATGMLEFVQKGGTLPYAGEVASYERLGDEDTMRLHARRCPCSSMEVAYYAPRPIRKRCCATVLGMRPENKSTKPMGILTVISNLAIRTAAISAWRFGWRMRKRTLML